MSLFFPSPARSIILALLFSLLPINIRVRGHEAVGSTPSSPSFGPRLALLSLEDSSPSVPPRRVASYGVYSINVTCVCAQVRTYGL